VLIVVSDGGDNASKHISCTFRIPSCPLIDRLRPWRNARSYPAFQNSLDRDNDTKIRMGQRDFQTGLLLDPCMIQETLLCRTETAFGSHPCRVVSVTYCKLRPFSGTLDKTLLSRFARRAVVTSLTRIISALLALRLFA